MTRAEIEKVLIDAGANEVDENTLAFGESMIIAFGEYSFRITTADDCGEYKYSKATVKAKRSSVGVTVGEKTWRYYSWRRTQCGV